MWDEVGRGGEWSGVEWSGMEWNGMELAAARRRTQAAAVAHSEGSRRGGM
jgi:hypothetical protein